MDKKRLGLCAHMGSFGTLDSVTYEQLDNDPRLGRRRREYRDSSIFKMGLWSEEHSAQLDPKENRRLQDLFKSGVRNILSATTTLELGIDIGGLNGVLMSNVPPGKANYLQRAGRAGRRADGSSMVTTFARPRPFDREVFERVGDYLGQTTTQTHGVSRPRAGCQTPPELVPAQRVLQSRDFSGPYGRDGRFWDHGRDMWSFKSHLLGTRRAQAET